MPDLNGFTEIPLRNKIKMIVAQFEKRKSFLHHNFKSFDIFQGNLMPYVKSVMRTSLSPQYFSRIEHRIYPLNILRKLIKKLARVYSTDPIRTVDKGQNNDALKYWENNTSINKIMNTADEFSHLFKGYAYKPIVRINERGENVPSAKVLPYDRFLPIGEDLRDPLKVTIFCEIMGKISKIDKKGLSREVDVLFCFTDTEFMAIDEEGDLLREFEKGNSGKNEAGFIPFYYGNRDDYEIIPSIDTDLVQSALLFPVLYSDLVFSTLWVYYNPRMGQSSIHCYLCIS